MADLERQLGDLLADGLITDEDADSLRQFGAFLRDSAAARVTPGRPIPTSVMRKHRDLLGLTDEEIDNVARRRGEPVATPEETPASAVEVPCTGRCEYGEGCDCPLDESSDPPVPVTTWTDPNGDLRIAAGAHTDPPPGARDVTHGYYRPAPPDYELCDPPAAPRDLTRGFYHPVTRARAEDPDG